MTMISKFVYILILFFTLPSITYAQAKPKRDSSRDNKTNTIKQQKKSHKKTYKTTTKHHPSKPKRSNQSSNRNNFDRTTLSVSSDNLFFSHEEDIQYITVNSNTTWYIQTTLEPWGHFSINGNQIRIKVDRNPYTTERTDYFKIVAGNKSVRINITQDKRPPTLSITPDALYISPSGETRTIYVDSDGEPWSIYMNTASWGHISKQGNRIQIQFDRNTNSLSRKDYFEIKSGNNKKRVNITQYGAHYTNEKSSSQSYYSNRSQYSTYTDYLKKSSWWKDRFSVGLVFFGDLNYNYFGNKDNGASLFYKYGIGLALRFGSYSDIFNFSTGTKWMGLGISNTYYSNGNSANYIVFPADIKFNLFYLGRKCKLYIGGGFEYGLGLNKSYNFMDWNTAIGINSRHVDWNIYYKQFIKCKGKEIFSGPQKHHIGTSLTYYF